MSKAAAIISYIFHPLLMTSYLFVTLFMLKATPVLPYINGFRQITLVIFLVTFVIPTLSVSFLILTKTIASFKLESRKERILPFSFITIFYGVASWMFLSKLSISGSISIVLIVITLLILLLTIITVFWKISAHASGMGGMLGFLTAFYLAEPRKDMLVVIVGLIVVTGMVLSSRLQLNAHKPMQVYAGLFLGFIFSFASILLFV